MHPAIVQQTGLLQEHTNHPPATFYHFWIFGFTNIFCNFVSGNLACCRSMPILLVVLLNLSILSGFSLPAPHQSGVEGSQLGKIWHFSLWTLPMIILISDLFREKNCPTSNGRLLDCGGVLMGICFNSDSDSDPPEQSEHIQSTACTKHQLAMSRC